MTKTLPDPTEQNQALICLMAHGACEFIATLALLMVVMGGFALLIVPFAPSILQIPLLAMTVGITLMLIIRSPIGKLSGAHLNPAISLAFWMQGRMRASEFWVYALMQSGGAICACALLAVLLPGHFGAIGYGVLSPAANLPILQLLLLEAGATAGLVVILFFLLSRQNLTQYVAVSVALYLTLMTYWLAPQTGASFNPARAYGAALAAHRLEGLWPYCLAPLIGSATATALYAIASWLPNPVYHRLNHSHDHANYTLHYLSRLWVKNH